MEELRKSFGVVVETAIHVPETPTTGQLGPRRLPKKPTAAQHLRAALLFIPAFFIPVLLPVIGLVYLKVSENVSIDRCTLRHNSGFSINIAMGNFTFAAAKWIDVAWDVIIGRGGQAALTWILFKVVQDTLVHIMESEDVDCEMFTTLTLSNSGVHTAKALSKRIWERKGERLRIAGLLLATVYVATFPTIMGAMTGYVTKEDSWVALYDGNLVDLKTWTEGVREVVQVEEGSKIGMDDWATVRLKDWEEITEKNHTILNGSNLYTVKNQTYNLGIHSLSGKSPMYTFRGALYPKTYLTLPSSRQCISTDHYAYGVSEVIWEIACVLQLLWTYGVYLLYVYANHASELCQAGRKLGTYRAVADLAEVFTKGLGECASAHEERVLHEQMSRRYRGFRYIVSRNGDGSMHLGLGSGGGERLRLENGDVYK
ncbi:hypothetical protein L873DRAFT_1789584 [Choiromyces venosus 120613-1]|uniref:Uncharacterized protein n=1 Tax=Choiromyces venosus 120613-1 TaxID=1336337 RepID=A0A3N4JRG6_9PEZI|nr:hypothetical protein L873DRAFT_1789584 [Choiromyces venosus 120613-1]